jgi:hypothetical protein
MMERLSRGFRQEQLHWLLLTGVLGLSLVLGIGAGWILVQEAMLSFGTPYAPDHHSWLPLVVR